MTHDHESMSDVFDDLLEELGDETDRQRKRRRHHHEEHDED